MHYSVKDLPPHLRQAAEALAGKTLSESDVLCIETMSATTEYRQAQEALEALLLEGVNSGEAKPMTAQDWEEIRTQVRRQLSATQS
jgi:hypothetical protein